MPTSLIAILLIAPSATAVTLDSRKTNPEPSPKSIYGPCDCLRWSDLYNGRLNAYPNVSCHYPRGYEYGQEGRCTNYFEHFDGTFPIAKILKHTNTSKLWCYVSAKCEDERVEPLRGIPCPGCPEPALKILAINGEDVYEPPPEDACTSWGIDEPHCRTLLRELVMPAKHYKRWYADKCDPSLDGQACVTARKANITA